MKLSIFLSSLLCSLPIVAMQTRDIPLTEIDPIYLVGDSISSVILPGYEVPVEQITADEFLQETTALPAPQAHSIKELFDKKNCLVITIPTAFSNTCRNHILDILMSAQEIYAAGINHIIVSSVDTPQVLARWKQQLNIRAQMAHKPINAQSFKQTKFITYANGNLVEKGNRLEPDTNHLLTHLHVMDFYKSGLGWAPRRTAWIISNNKIVYRVAEKVASETASTCTKGLLPHIRTALSILKKI